MTPNFTSTKDASTNGVKILVYGPAGAGKTTLCGTLPTPLILSAEAGLLSLRHLDIPVIEIKTIDDLANAYQWLTESPDAAHFQSVALDSVSEIAEVVLANAKKLVKDPRQAYGELIEKMTMVIRNFRDLPGKNVLFTCKQEKANDEVTGRTMFAPMMPGAKLAQQIPYFFDEVFNLDIGKAQDSSTFRFIRTQPDLQYTAKDRSGALEAIETPCLATLINKIVTNNQNQ